MRVSVSKNFEIPRWSRILFFPESKLSGGVGMKKPYLENIGRRLAVWLLLSMWVSSAAVLSRGSGVIAEQCTRHRCLPSIASATLPARVGLHDLANYPDRYPHICDGEYAKAFEGAYFAVWSA